MPSTPAKGPLRLAHVALTSPDPERLARSYEAIVGLVRLREQSDGALRMTTDRRHHCLELHTGPERSLHHIAFEVREIEPFAAALAAAGVASRPVESPGYAEAIAFADPEGNEVRLARGGRTSAAIAADDRAFRPSKIGHVGVCAADPAGQLAFYTEVLGFRLSDWIGEQVVFLRCNPDHHALVFVAEPAERPSVHHVAYEVGSFEDFARQADLLAAGGVRVDWGPGRHAPSHNYFMYFDDADGNRIEWVNSIKQIAEDGSYEPQVYDPAAPTTWNVWGVMPPAHFLRRIGPAAAAAS